MILPQIVTGLLEDANVCEKVGLSLEKQGVKYDEIRSKIKADQGYFEAELERFEKDLIRVMLEFRELKHTHYVGQEKHMYQHVAETLLESRIFGLSLEKIDVEAYNSIEALCKGIVIKRENILH